MLLNQAAAPASIATSSTAQIRLAILSSVQVFSGTLADRRLAASTPYLSIETHAEQD